VPERVAVGLLNRRADRGAYVSKEQVRRYVAGELAQVRVVPGRLDASEHTRCRLRVVPADTEPVAVRRLGAQLGVQALVNQRVGRRV